MTEIHNNILAFTVSPPGGGKTYFTLALEKVVPGLIRVSSDELRKELTGDENNLSKDKEVFELLPERIEVIANNARDIIYDATNVKFKNRNFLYKIAYKTNHHLVAFIINVSKEKCFAQNKNRKRVVPDDVIEKMFKSLHGPSLDEVDLIVTVDSFDENNVKARFKGLNLKSSNFEGSYLLLWNSIESWLENNSRFK